MKRIKMVGLDLDGTLLNEKKEVTPYTRAVLEKAIAQGIHIVISTGRPITGVPKELLELPGTRYVITSNGGRIIDMETGELIYDNPVPHDIAREVLKIVFDYETLKEIYFDGQGYVPQEELDHIEKYVPRIPVQEYILRTRKPIADIWEKMDEMDGKGVDKVHAIFARESEVELARERIKALNSVVISGSIGSNLEMNAPGVHKGNGLLALGKILGITREEIMACGDGGNDLEMIKSVGFGVAMENAIEEVKAAADYITCSNEEDGVAKAIEKFVL